jgi:hypothetical protein
MHGPRAASLAEHPARWPADGEHCLTARECSFIEGCWAGQASDVAGAWEHEPQPMCAVGAQLAERVGHVDPALLTGQPEESVRSVAGPCDDVSRVVEADLARQRSAAPRRETGCRRELVHVLESRSPAGG